MKYVFVAYKPESHDYCRGCHVATYPANFVSKSSLTEEELISEWGTIQLANNSLDTNEEGYAVQIWRDGMLVWDGIDGVGPQGEFEDENDYVRLAEQMHEIESKAYDLGAKAKVELDRAAKEAREAAERKQKEEAQEMRRKQFEALKKEFGE